MAPEQSNDESDSPVILFPEIIAVAVAALATPVLLAKMFLSGHVLVGVAGSLTWFAALVFTVRFIRRRQYFFALWPMLVILGLCLLIHKDLSQ